MFEKVYFLKDHREKLEKHLGLIESSGDDVTDNLVFKEQPHSTNVFKTYYN